MGQLVKSFFWSLFVLCGLTVATLPSDTPSGSTSSSTDKGNSAVSDVDWRIADKIDAYLNALLTIGNDTCEVYRSILDDFPTADELDLTPRLGENFRQMMYNVEFA